uniref:Uncharacterized protein n=1 Tax=Timema cristinae TaxID=61476 RepID=A0A7R9D852_TIMCR|nr:unnamed protein product [Timema cristinae]
MEDCVYDSELKNTEMERTCEVFIKEENITEYEMEINPLEFVSVAVKSEVVDYCEPDSSSDEPSVKQKAEMCAQDSTFSQSTTQLLSENNPEYEETKTHSVITNNMCETKCDVDCCKQGHLLPCRNNKVNGLCDVDLQLNPFLRIPSDIQRPRHLLETLDHTQIKRRLCR